MPHALAPQQPTPHTAIDYTDDALPQHMLVPEGEDINAETPPLIQHDDDMDSKDADNDVESSPSCQYSRCTTRGRRPTLYQEKFPYVTSIAEYDLVEAHDCAFLACFPSYKDMWSSQADSQVRLMEEFNTMQDLDVKKRKACLCVRGDQQVEGIDYFETHAPVVSWSTLRTVMTLAVNL
eukprot:11665901-Ditylum_brightwellii.AAC.1